MPGSHPQELSVLVKESRISEVPQATLTDSQDKPLLRCCELGSFPFYLKSAILIQTSTFLRGWYIFLMASCWKWSTWAQWPQKGMKLTELPATCSSVCRPNTVLWGSPDHSCDSSTNTQESNEILGGNQQHSSLSTVNTQKAYCLL